MIVNVCPSARASAPAERVWQVLTNPELLGEWTDVAYASSEPAGPPVRGQVIRLKAPGLGLTLPVTIEIGDMDPDRRWIDMLVRLPFGITNREVERGDPGDGSSGRSDAK
jgi:activator of Hsp90 ATPase-like protein